jgi:hypothetical protein
MSYIRCAWPLEWFKDESHEYVFLSDDGKGGTFVEDYGSKFSHTPSLIEMIGKIIWQTTGDRKFATKIVTILAMDYGLQAKLRHRPLTASEMVRRMERKSKEIMKELELRKVRM